MRHISIFIDGLSGVGVDVGTGVGGMLHTQKLKKI